MTDNSCLDTWHLITEAIIVEVGILPGDLVLHPAYDLGVCLEYFRKNTNPVLWNT